MADGAAWRREYYESYWTAGLGGWSPAHEGASREELELLSRVVRPNSRVLEIGCGDGRIGRVLRGLLGSEHRYVGVDVSPTALERARLSGLETLLWDGHSPLPLGPEEFDVVLCFEVLEHVFLPEQLLREALRVLRRGGRLAGSVPNVAFVANRLLFLLGYFNPGGSPATSLRAPWRDPHVRFFTPRTLRSLLVEVGCSAVRIEGQRFQVTDLPVLYRARGRLRQALLAIGWPLGVFGLKMRSLFAARLYFVGSRR